MLGGHKESCSWSQAGTSGIATAPLPVVSHHGPRQLVTPRIKQAACCQGRGDLHTPRERQAGLRTAQLSAGMAADPAQEGLRATGLPQPQALGTGTAAELSHGNRAQARLGYGQALPMGSPAPTPQPQPPCPTLGTGSTKMVPGPLCPRWASPPKRGQHCRAQPPPAQAHPLQQVMPYAQMDGVRLNYWVCQQQS